MEAAKFKIKAITLSDMLNRQEQSYNPATWKERVERMTNYDKLQFYVIEADDVFSYARFFASYVADGIYFFNKFSAFSSSITNNGFCKVTIDNEGNVYKHLFKDATGKEGYAENCKSNRLSFAKDLTPIGVMVSNCI